MGTLAHSCLLAAPFPASLHPSAGTAPTGAPLFPPLWGRQEMTLATTASLIKPCTVCFRNIHSLSQEDKTPRLWSRWTPWEDSEQDKKAGFSRVILVWTDPEEGNFADSRLASDKGKECTLLSRWAASTAQRVSRLDLQGHKLPAFSHVIFD